jgi:PTH1 family peptidyl-tRNA hydrolase
LWGERFCPVLCFIRPLFTLIQAGARQINLAHEEQIVMTPLFFPRSRKVDDATDATTVLVVGLGNPGREYRESRHNVGFMLVDRLADELSVKMTRVQHRAIVGSGSLEETRIILAKPQTFMNLSGAAVASLIRFYKIPLDRLMVVNDDIDLPFGMLRLRPGGGSAGHKGVQSIIDRLGTQQFARLRIGVGRPPGSKQGASYVLQDFSTAEREELAIILKEAADAVRVFALQGIESAMNRFNGPVFED